MSTTLPRPIIFLDFDGVLVIDAPDTFGGLDVCVAHPPPEVWTKLFHRPAIEMLAVALEAWNPRIVITTSWLRLMVRDGFIRLFRETHLPQVSAAFHAAWDAPQNYGETRCNAIERWLRTHHACEPYVILDDHLSGTGLHKSRHRREGRVVLCDESTGLQRNHLTQIQRALATTPSRTKNESP